MVLGLGNFDGVHIAHQALFQLVKELGDHAKPHAACGAFCFTQPSADYLMSSPPLHLCTLEQKLELFRSLGIEYAFVADFSKVMHLTPSEFVRKILIDRCHCVGAVCGFNYRFGKGGSGNAQTLKELLDAPVVIQDAVYDGSEPVSSTRIRKLLSEGYVEDAAKMLSCTKANVRWHLSKILEKTGYRTRMELLIAVASKNLIIVTPDKALEDN